MQARDQKSQFQLMKKQDKERKQLISKQLQESIKTL